MHLNSILNLLRIGLSGAIVLMAFMLLYYLLKKRSAEKLQHLNAGRISKAEHEAMMGKEVRGMSHYRSRAAKMEARIRRCTRSMQTVYVLVTLTAVLLAGLELLQLLVTRPAQ